VVAAVDSPSGVPRAGVIRLRPLCAADVDPLARLYTEPEAATAPNWFGFSPAGAARSRSRVAAGETITEGGGSLAVTDEAGDLVGEVSWRQTDNSTPPNGRCWNVGIFVLPEARGRDYGSAAQRAIAEYLFSHTPAMRVEASTEAGNLAEQRALEKAGYSREGVLRKAVFRGGGYRDMVMFSILRTEL
jgi:RimJ/RimL family protein N-acetyltransferase